jgi:hypothetical protein
LQKVLKMLILDPIGAWPLIEVMEHVLDDRAPRHQSFRQERHAAALAQTSLHFVVMAGQATIVASLIG